MERESRPSISAFFPAYNEAGNIQSVVRAASEVLRREAEEHEIIVVDDGSTDGTAQRVQELQAEIPELRLVQHPLNRGYGGALISGFEAARLPWVFFSDGDHQFDLGEIPLLLARRQEAELVIGYRRNRQDRFHRRLNAWGWGLVVWAVLGLRIRDVDCAFKLIRRQILPELELRCQGATISAELLAKARRRGHRIVEVGVSHLPRTTGESSGANPSVILKAFLELFRLRRSL